jgi:hypothetical protein
MNNRIHCIACIITSDLKKQENYIVSSSPNQIIFPSFIIESPRALNNEIRYTVKNLFKPNVFKFIQEIVISFTELQNDLLISYIESLNNPQYDINNDIFLLCGIVLHSKLPLENSKYHWSTFQYNFESSGGSNQIFIIDYVLQRLIV